MYIKVKSYRIIWNYRELAIVKMQINLFTMKLKAIIKLSNNDEHIIYSVGETNDDFQRRVEIFVHSKSNLY
jgi:hypothetical protein